MYLELDPGTNYWSRQTNSAYSGNGSARFNSFSAPNGTEQSISASFATFSPPLLYARYLTFDEAYAPYNNPAFGPDSLYVESSTNGGVTYTLRAALYGSYSVEHSIPLLQLRAPTLLHLENGDQRYTHFLQEQTKSGLEL